MTAAKRKVAPRTGNGTTSYYRKPRPSTRQPRSQAPPFNHIQLKNTLEEVTETKEQNEDRVLLVIRNGSLQPAIDEGTAQSIANKRPKTFAEATMSRQTGRGRKNSGMGDKGNNSFDSIAGPVGAESFKVTFKKKKKTPKWSVLDLSDNASGPASTSINASDPALKAGSGGRSDLEVKGSGDAEEASEPAKAATTSDDVLVPAQSTEPISASTPRPPSPHASSIPSHSGAPASASVSASAVGYVADPDSKPTEIENPEALALTVRAADVDTISDSQSVKDRFEAAASRITEAFPAFVEHLPDSPTFSARMGRDDGFDTLEWDPDLPPASDNNSPEPLAVKPQPLAYTTVGSLVNPSVVPQFSAPNRIQREGTGRRMQTTRDYQDAYFHRRPSAAVLNTTSSMQYTQQLGHGLPNHNGPPALPPRNSARAPSLNAEDPLMRLEGLTISRVRPSNKVAGGASSSTSQNDQNTGLARSFEGDNDHSTKAGNDLAGMEKMQTLQRMANYENPYQEAARNRLSEFAAARAQTGTPQTMIGTKTISNPTGQADANNANNGADLDRAFRFPHSELATSSQQGNFLSDALPPRSSQTTNNTYNPPPGYPRPLTAGPPGQRTSAVAFNTAGPRIADMVKDIRTAQNPTAYNNPGSSYQHGSPWSTQYDNLARQQQASMPTPVDLQTKPTDTLPMSAITRYYPRGFPANMDGNFTPLAQSVRDEMDRALMSESSKAASTQAQKDKELDDWFYSGQRKYAMTAEEHVSELERDVHAAPQPPPTNPFGPIGPPKKARAPVNNKPITVEQMNSKSTAEAAAPLVDAVFGTMLGYAEKGPTSRAKQSGFTTSPAWHIDDSDKGNESFFGEDWGPPPKRAGRDARYQPDFHNPNDTHWE